MAHLVARIIPLKLGFSSSVLTADVLQAQIVTAGGLLQWLHAKAKQAREAWAGSLALAIVVGLIGWILRAVQKKGVESIDPEQAGTLGDHFRRLGASIRLVTAAGDTSGMADRFLYRRFFRALRRQAAECAEFAGQFEALDRQWQLTVSAAAKERIAELRAAAQSSAVESGFWLESMDEYAGPSEEAIKAQLARTVTSPAQPRG